MAGKPVAPPLLCRGKAAEAGVAVTLDLTNEIDFPAEIVAHRLLDTLVAVVRPVEDVVRRVGQMLLAGGERLPGFAP